MVSSYSEDVASEVRAQLGRARMSQNVLALQLGVSPMYVSRRLSGELSFTIDDLDRIAQALHIPRETLLKIGDTSTHAKAS